MPQLLDKDIHSSESAVAFLPEVRFLNGKVRF